MKDVGHALVSSQPSTAMPLVAKEGGLGCEESVEECLQRERLNLEVREKSQQIEGIVHRNVELAKE